MHDGMKHTAVLVLELVLVAGVMACGETESEHAPVPVATTIPTQAASKIESEPIGIATSQPTAISTEKLSTQTPRPISNLSPELAATCAVDSKGKILCHAHRTSMKSNLSWTYMDKDQGGAEFEFSPYEPIPSEILVTLQECIGSSCSEVEILVDTGHLTKDDIPVNEKADGGTTSSMSNESSLYPELAAICSIDSEWKVACQAHKTSDESKLFWTYIDKTSGSNIFEFSLREPIMRGPVILRECVHESCTEVETTIDVSHLDTSGITNRMTMQSTYSQGNCDPNGAHSLGSPPMNVSDIVYILPMGHMQGDHITPIDHLYVFFTPNKTHDIYAMADGHIVKVSDHGIDHRIIIEYSCDLYSIYIHITDLSETIKSQLEWKFPKEDSEGQSISRVPVKQGEVVGRTGGRDSFDLSVVDTRVTLDGFVNLDSYAGEFWKFRTVNPFDYWDKSFKQELLNKTFYINEDFPGGKIDLDVDGKLVGNWFKEGTGGYSGLRTDDDPHGVRGHLSFARSILVPDTLWISFGSYGESGKPQNFGVNGNEPAPADIGVGSGSVKFELKGLDRGPGPTVESGFKLTSTGKWWDGKSYPENRSLVAVYRDDPAGVLLVEMLDARTIKTEVFENKEPDEVTGFTDNAKIYGR